MPDIDIDNINNFTPRAQQVVELARQAMLEFGGSAISTEHILEGQLKLGLGIAANIFKKLGVDLDTLREANIQNLRALEKPTENVSSNKLRFTKKTKELLERAAVLTRQMGHTYIGTEHLFLALLQIDSPATQLLRRANLSFEEMKKQVLLELDPNSQPEEKTPHLGKAKQSEVGPFTPISEVDEIGFHVLLDPGSAPTQVIAEVLEAIAELNRAVGGQGMIFLDCPDEANVFVGVRA